MYQELREQLSRDAHRELPFHGRVERRVLKCCPYYRSLASVLSKFSFYGEKPPCGDSVCTDIVTFPRQDEQDHALSLEFRRKTEECKLLYLQKSTHRFLATAREKQECELEIERYRVAAEKHRIDIEGRRRKMVLRADAITTRNVLKGRRVPKDEIDQVLPIPKV
ncbi:hypothetical protein F442_05555 [Phytophthora nicotianae P10297]|uniref:Uncharacterized protein n=1 Tax=Phytophthora nicotianae P10297 TaxID=1317064 RepID=W2ZP52_PHYNI|nr:hypothetical protein F442_05555 [Phytophthora nicotianae P10297]